jgi:phospholipase C
MKYAWILPFALAVLIVSCSGGQQTAVPLGSTTIGSNAGQGADGKVSPYIKHIIVIFQENRTPDDLFQGLASEGADIQSWGMLGNKRVDLKETTLATGYDLGHGHNSFIEDYDCGKNDGFGSKLPKEDQMRPYAYAPLSQVQPYVDMGKQYVFGDKMFATQQAGSFPAHQYIVSASGEAQPATTDDIASNPYSSKSGHPVPAGCDGPADGVVDTISAASGSPGPSPLPCFNQKALSDLLDAHGITWRYYQHHLGPGLWHAFDAIRHVRYGPDYANVITPSTAVLSDISTGSLPSMSWVLPVDGKHSDHPGYKSATGPSWVAAVVNAVGNSQYWDSTAIVITWDEWGGMNDHVVPPNLGPYMELGFRVPLLVISPYAKQGYVSHVQYEFGSIIAFAEETFGIKKGALGATDKRANDLADAFDFKQAPRPFVTISAPPLKVTDAAERYPDGGDTEDPDDDATGPVSGCITSPVRGHQTTR